MTNFGYKKLSISVYWDRCKSHLAARERYLDSSGYERGAARRIRRRSLGDYGAPPGRDTYCTSWRGVTYPHSFFDERVDRGTTDTTVMYNNDRPMDDHDNPDWRRCRRQSSSLSPSEKSAGGDVRTAPLVTPIAGRILLPKKVLFVCCYFAFDRLNSVSHS